MTVVRVQVGHWGRKAGATGAYNPTLRLSEADMNHRLSLELQKVTAGDSRLVWQFVGPDEERGDPCHLFMALHMDGSENPAAIGPSVGYPPRSTESARFAKMWKPARNNIAGANGFRPDNYTPALSGYYGFSRSYSGTAPVKVVIENGFVTNHDEANWANMHRTDVAEALRRTVHAYYGFTVNPSEQLAERVDELEKETRRLSIQNARQAKYINGLQTRVTNLEAGVN